MARMKVTKSYNYNVTCDVCGFKMKAAEAKIRWDGKLVCKDDFEFRHSLDYFMSKNDVHVLPWTRPDNQRGIGYVFRITSTGDFRIISSGEKRTLLDG